jgi:hypothetical protein
MSRFHRAYWIPSSHLDSAGCLGTLLGPGGDRDTGFTQPGLPSFSSDRIFWDRFAIDREDQPDFIATEREDVGREGCRWIKERRPLVRQPQRRHERDRPTTDRHCR